LDFVPSAPSTKKGRRPDRCLGIRIERRQKEFFADGREVRYFAVVTNDFERDGLALLQWHGEQAGTIEHTHDVLENDLAAGVLPSGRFEANAAWLRRNVLVYNLLSALRRTALPADLARARPKRLRFRLFGVAATLIHHARQLRITRCAKVIGLRGSRPDSSNAALQGRGGCRRSVRAVARRVPVTVSLRLSHRLCPTAS
jgi:hypothetical protein